MRLIVIDEDLYVRANRVLFVDDAKAKPGIAVVEFPKKFVKRCPGGFYFVLLPGV